MFGSYDRRIFPAGAVLFSEGDAAEEAYLVMRGRVDLLTRRNNTDVRVGQRTVGEIVGELALMADRPRATRAVAGEDTEVLTLTRDGLSSGLESIDPLLRLWLGAMFERFRATSVRDQWSSGGAEVSPPTGWARHVAEASNRLATQQDLRRAITREELELRFQPIVRLATGQLAGFEALMRWHHPVRGAIPPDVFVAIAEANGMIAEITDLCLRLVARQFPSLGAAAAARGIPRDRPLFMAVNISAADLERQDFAATAAAILRSGGVDPATIRLEVTESVLVKDTEAATRILQQCRDHGMRIAIDDFGTGYSSLNYLYALPASSVKMDKSFTRSLLSDNAGRKIIEAILKLAKELDLDVVAEGIETEADAALLASMGTRYGQGYLFGKPMPLQQAIELIEASGPPARVHVEPPRRVWG